MKFELSFANKEITPWGGMVFLKQMLDKIGFKQAIEKCEFLPVSLSNNSYKKEVLLESFITSIWCGANRFLYTEVTWANKALRHLFGWKHTSSQEFISDTLKLKISLTKQRRKWFVGLWGASINLNKKFL